ncbi:MAG: PadR family transcriptional regulator [Nitrososphaerales archaeon]
MSRKLKYISSDIYLIEMVASWLQRVGSSVPRGFSRFYVLNILKEQAMTGKQIIESATEESDGMWKPSAGLVYPLLGRLLQEGLIEENDDGKYTITKKGISVLEDLQSIQDVIKKQMDVLMRLGNVGKFVAMDILDRVTSMASTLNENLDNMTKAQRDQYKKFLQGTLKKLDEKEGKQKVEVE